MARFNRREFMGSVLAGAAATRLSPASAQPAAAKMSPTDLVTLGRSGVKVSRLGMGTGVRGGNRSSNATRMGAEKFLPLMKYAFDHGITFFDVADLYGTHDFLHRLVAEVGRDKVQIQSKIWWMDGSMPEKTTNATVAVERFLREVGTDHLDSVLLHCCMDDKWATRLEDFMGQLEDCKTRGLIRSHGVSCHSFGALRTALASPWLDVVLARVNHRGSKMDGKPSDIAAHLRAMRDAGKGVIGMKLYGEGEIRQPDERLTSLKYVVTEKCVDAIVIGLEAIEHIDETLVNFQAALNA
ncbi:MAG: aldo/keto reductase [Armatimonadetes bacterium]|nr:aldo/keto reductase [Armatimonadota bacterium]